MRPTNITSTFAAVSVVLLLLSVSACTEQETTRTGQNDTLVTEPGLFPDTAGVVDMLGRSDTVHVSLTDHEINMPQNLRAGTTVFHIMNDGATEHNFEIEGQGIEEMLATNLQPGESGTLSVDLQEGPYTVYCPVHDHRELGMELTITVNQMATGM
jgi:uncharacterized cupredoxin-like copper-binding protein